MLLKKMEAKVFFLLRHIHLLIKISCRSNKASSRIFDIVEPRGLFLVLHHQPETFAMNIENFHSIIPF
jgi:hypothetical protein